MYKNQKELDELQKVVGEIIPGLRIGTVSTSGDRVVTALIYVDEKGNKAAIDKLISIGFRKICRRKRTDPFRYWALDASYTFVITLEKVLNGGADDGTD